MKKALFLCAAFAAQVFSAELICAPSFEVVGMNPDFGKSSIKVLQGQMEAKMNSRQLAAPSASDSISAADAEGSQISWAKSRGCSHLLQATLTRLGETVQVSARLVDLSSSSYVFKKAYKASSPDDLHPVFQQLGNTLQDPKFTAVETIYDVTNADAKALTKKRTSSYYQIAVGASYYSRFKDLYSLGAAYSWDNRIIIGEAIANLKFKDDNSLMELGLRILYPFSDKNNSFYLGGGASFVSTEKSYETPNSYGYYDDHYETDIGLLLEASAGYLIGRASGFVVRFEAYGDALLQGKNSIGCGARMVFGIVD